MSNGIKCSVDSDNLFFGRGIYVEYLCASVSSRVLQPWIGCVTLVWGMCHVLRRKA